jgi:hypothetical protein
VTPDWNTLQAAIAGDVLLPEADGYETLRKPALARFWTSAPRPWVVPRCLEGLHVAVGVGCSAGELVLAGVASHSKDQPHHAYVPTGVPRVASAHRPSTATSTRFTGPLPDQARPESSTDPGSTKRRREKKSGIPGGIMSALTRIRPTGSRGSSASRW